ncbi:hypothetical protein CWR48_14000 [Oceanobacillus arenosus]|uniref:Transglycosylase n=1 Tax=Oceanobacillus arenosus TaxID=1229153 RepID=A0A3D8PNS5_9BACI|nr:hypothetical protein [Oceanobacillus arenosus]RDW17624.1 hypothetical protein CWR48_14000 [Oceanobacillus arenosus]
MTQPLTAICDQCGKITDVVFKQRHHPNKVQETFFKCEHCHYHYTSFVTDSKVRKMQRNKDKLPVYEVDKRMELQTQINNRMGTLKYNLIQFGRADL